MAIEQPNRRLLASTRLVRTLLVWTTLALTLASTPPLFAQSTDDIADETARFHFEAGASYYNQGRYEDAAREYKEAYRLSKRPSLLINLSYAYERLGKTALATKILRNFLKNHPRHKDRLLVEQRLDVLSKSQTSEPPQVSTNSKQKETQKSENAPEAKQRSSSS